MEKYTVNVQIQDKDSAKEIKSIHLEVEANNLEEAKKKAIEMFKNNPIAYIKDYLEKKLRIDEINRNGLIKISLE